jgi:glutamate N-acetyltransferase/amino-acid N-acetyltransferase
MRKSITSTSLQVPGFLFTGLAAGIKKGRKSASQKGGKDLALIFSERPAGIAGVFTSNQIKAAPLILDIERIRRNKKGQAIIINSGNANACTGKQGLRDAGEMAEITARALGIPTGLVYVSSTGIIGKPLPMQVIRKAIPEAVKSLSPHALREAASAIMTTDTFLKIASKKISLDGKTGTIAGIAKGAGMVSPNMATMLVFIVTDIAVKTGALDALLKKSVRKSFNRLTIDNDMSTNDMVLIMANGLLGNKPVGKYSSQHKKLEEALNEVAYSLSRDIARDGEGATKLIEVVVKGAKTESDAEEVAKKIANSMLVKTAVYGKSPNWGRIMAAIGSTGATIREQKISIHLNNTRLVNNGIGVYSGVTLGNIFSKKEITITVNLGLGEKEARSLTCDLTEKYVRMNADYMT